MTTPHPYAIVSCDACGAPLGDERGGSGLLVFSRGDDEWSVEEPPLCERCGLAVGMTALVRWAEEEDGG